MADEVGAALLRAAGRGVTCRVLLDAIGSAQFLKGRLLAQLKAGGVEVAFALPVSSISVFKVRPDLRLHRKIVVVDDAVGYTGSFNLDVRSFWLDFEVTLGVYDPGFAERLLALQDKYIEDSIPVDLQTWQQRPGKERFIENLARLASPLL